MDPKLEIIAVIILLLSNVTVNSHHFINHLRTLGLRALTIPRMKLRNAHLCSPSTYPNCISDVTERSILKDDNAALYEESGDARYFRENGYQKVPTRKSFNSNVDDVNAIQDQSHLSSRTLNIFPILNKLAKNFIPKANANRNWINRERNNLTDKGDHLVIDVSETKLHVKPAYEDEYVGINIADYIRILERFERKFYMATFDKLTSIAPEDRRENGISFVQSGLFLQLLLTALLTEVDEITRIEIEDTLKLNKTDYVGHSDIIREAVALLPNSSEVTRFRWTSRLMLPKGKKLSREFLEGPAAALRLHVDNFSGTEEPTEITDMLNLMIEKDSGGAIRDTFDGEDFLGPVDGVLMTTVYLRAQWRSSPTLLNGTHEFYDSDAGPYRTVRMIRINDEMNYAKIDEWNTQVIEIFYRTPGLSLVVLVCNECSIHELARRVAETDISAILERVRPLRVAVTLPLYTLRMTLLLPNKLQAMGIHHLVESTNGTSDSLRISHAVQRLMFWAEAGRNAYKDDGIEWDLEANLELLVNRPYVFFVRWKNITLMQGNFVL